MINGIKLSLNGSMEAKIKGHQVMDLDVIHQMVRILKYSLGRKVDHKTQQNRKTGLPTSLSTSVGKIVPHTAHVFMVLFFLAGIATNIEAQTPPDYQSNRLGVAPAVTPASAWAYYQAQGVSSPSIDISRPVRINDLAKNLHNDPDEIYAFVHDGIEYEPLFGLKKGAYGSIVHKSGTAFDQSHLMVELLRASNITAEYVYGSITVSKVELESWLGVSALTGEAAERIFANGGVPVSVTGSGLNFTNITIAHVWVKAKINGIFYQFDPAFKQHTVITGAIHDGSLNLTTVMGGSASNIISAAAPSGLTSSFVHHVNGDGIEASINGYAQSLSSHFKANYRENTIESIVGGKRLIRISGKEPVRQTSNSHQASVLATWAGEIPGPFRTQITINITSPDFFIGPPPQTADTVLVQLSSEKLAGRRLSLTHGIPIHSGVDVPALAASGKIQLMLDNQILGEVSSESYKLWNFPFAAIALTVNHPYAADAGAFMDQLSGTQADLNGAVAIVISVGAVAPDYSNELSRKLPLDDFNPRAYHDTDGDGDPDGGCVLNIDVCGPPLGQESLIATKHTGKVVLGASYLAQTQSAMDVHARMLQGVSTHHHSLGVVTSRFNIWPNNTVREEQVFLDIESSWSFSKTTGTQAEEVAATRKFLHALGGTLNALEAGVALQNMEQPDAIAVAADYNWFNDNTVAPGQWANINEGFYKVDAANYASVASTLAARGQSDAMPNNAQTLVNEGFTLVFPSQRVLGPLEKPWRRGEDRHFLGRAIISINETSGEIAHLLQFDSLGLGNFKGGGAPTLDAMQLPSIDGEFLEDQFESFAGSFDVALDSGEMIMTPPPDLVVGNDEFPNALSFQRTYSTASKGREGPLGLGWTHTYDIRLDYSSDGGIVYGNGEAVHAARTLAAFAIMHGIASPPTISIEHMLVNAIVQNWWSQSTFNNVVTVHRGNQSERFFRGPNGIYLTPAGSVSSLVQTNEPELVRTEVAGLSTNATFHLNICGLETTIICDGFWTSVQKGYRYKDVSFTYTLGDRSTIDFIFGPAPDYNREINWFSALNPGSFPADLGKGVGRFKPTLWHFPTGIDVTFNYDVPGSLIGVSNSLGRIINLEVTESAAGMGVTAVSDNYNHSVSFSYETLAYLDDRQISNDKNAKLLRSVNGLENNTHTYEYEDPDHYFQPVLRGIGGVSTGLVGGTLLSPLLTRVFLADGDPANDNTAHLNIKYNDHGRVESVTNKNGDKQEYYIAEGVRGESRDPIQQAGDVGGFTEYFNEFGRSVRTRDALGWLTINDHDDIGRVIETRQVHEDALATNANAFSRRSTFAYDANGAQVCAAQHAAGDVSSTCLSPAGSALITSTQYANATYPLQPTRTTSPGGAVQNFSYFSNGLTSQTTGPQTTTYTYDAFGLMLTQTEALGALQSGGAGATRTTTFGGYVKGLPTTKTVSSGALSQTSNFTWSPAGDLTQITSPAGRITSAIYDDARRITSTVNGAQNASAKTTSAFTYDTNGRLASIREGKEGIAAPVITNAANWYSTSVAYGTNGRASSITDPSGDVQSFTYTPAGRLLRTTDGAGQMSEVMYNLRGDIVGEITGAGTANAIQRHESSFTLPGERTRLRQAKGIFGNLGVAGDNSSYDTNWAYDAFGRVSSITFPGGSSESFTYDKDGNQLSHRRRNGEIISSTYDTYGRILSKTFPGASQSFGYNASGMALSSSKTSGGLTEAIALSYDALGRVAQHEATRTPTAGSVTSYEQAYVYDNDNLLSTLSYSACQGACAAMATLSYSYDALGRAASISFPGGSATYAYGANTNRLAGRHYGGASAANSAVSMLYAYASDGDVTQLSYDLASLGTPVNFDFTNDGAGRLTAETISDPAWMWKPTTERITAYDGANTLDQLTGYTRTQGSGTPEVTDLCYDGSGNLSGTSTTGSNACSAPVRAYTHDANNRMTGASDTVTAMNASYVYGAEESRIYKQDGASGYRFANYNDMVLGEHPGTSGSALGSWRLYVPGIGIDDRIAMVDMSGNTATAVHYYMPNRIGSVVGMVNTAGVLTDQYLYSPYGVEEPLAGSGNLFRYTGRYYDAETGLYYYRKRYYDPGTGRFPSPDSILYAGGLNIYNYTGGDPINNVDPSGNCPHCIAAGVGAIIGIGIELAPAILTGNYSQLTVGGVVGAGAGGAAAGLTVLGTRSTVAAGAAAGAVDSVVRQGIDNTIANGGNVLAGVGDINLAEVATETTIGAAAGATPIAKIKGITSGRGSFQNVARTQMTQKIVEPGRKLSASTIRKIGVVAGVTELVPGVVSQATGSVVNGIGEQLPNATPENVASCTLVASGCNNQ